MSDLIIDGDSLRATAGWIRQVVDAFATAGLDAHEAADHVGHGALAGRVKEFADGWDVHRGKFSDELRQLADAFEAVDDTFADLDNRAAGAVGSAFSTTADAGSPARRGGSSGAFPSDPASNLQGARLQEASLQGAIRQEARPR